MAYKKYIKRNGKIYGPYYYKSKRVGDKVVSEYVGENSKKSFNFNKKHLIIFLGIFLVAVLIFAINFTSFSGNAISKLFEERPEKVELVDSGLAVNYDLETLNKKSSEGSFEQTARAYKDWIIVKFEKGDYEIEYSYSNKLTKDELNSLVEKDKENWLEKISNS